MSKPVVYIASPYTKGDVGMNVRFQMETFERLMIEDRVWPVAPLWSHFQHILFPHSYQEWINYDLALLPRYDACLRLKSEYPRLMYEQIISSGADGEVSEFMRLKKPVFFSIRQMYDWAEGWIPDQE